MKKGLVVFALLLFVSISFVSANIFTDFWNKITGKAVTVPGDSGCTNGCTSEGVAICSGNYTRTCGNYDADECLEYSSPTYCQYGCLNGICNPAPSPTCTNECTSGAVVCSGDYTKTCGNYDSDSCTEWNTGTLCPYGCSNGICQSAPTTNQTNQTNTTTPTCTNECTKVDALSCSGNYSIKCGNYDSDSCTEWGTGSLCEYGCSNGACNSVLTHICTNECLITGSVQCSGSYAQKCGNYNTDNCLEWSSKLCNYGCTNGICNLAIPQNNTNQTNTTLPYILPNNYSTISGCDSFMGDNNSPLKILFVNLGNAPHFEELKNDIINNELKIISPFKENYDKMVFYSIKINYSDEMGCSGSGSGSLSGSGFSCNNEKIYEEIEKQCTIDDKRGIITIVIAESIWGGSGGDIIYIGSSSKNDLNIQRGLSKNVAIHEITHNFGFADLYYGTYYFDGRPSQFWPTNFSRVFLNVDGPGCNKWCNGYKPVSQYTQSISSQCLKFTDKNSCTSFGRDSERFCIHSGEHPDCCVWSDEPFEYFNTNCVPAFGSEDIGQNCFEGNGCYYGAVYGNYAWRPVLSQTDSLMFSLGSEKFSNYEESILSNIFNCCLSDYSSNIECESFRMDFSDLLQKYNWKKRVGSCGYKLNQNEPTSPLCGNNIIESNELCDDGNTVNGDGCSSICVKEPFLKKKKFLDRFKKFWPFK